MVELPEPIRCFFESTNRGDDVCVISCFAADATLSDWGRTFEGWGGVAAWDKTDNTGVRSHLEALKWSLVDGRVRVTVRVTGDGFNGVGEMLFTLKGNLIARLDIQ